MRRLLGAQADVARAQAHTSRHKRRIYPSASESGKEPCERRAGQGDWHGTYPDGEGEISKQRTMRRKRMRMRAPAALQADLQKRRKAAAQRGGGQGAAGCGEGARGARASGSGVRAGRVKQVSHEDRGCPAKLAKVERARAQLDAAQLNLSYTETPASRRCGDSQAGGAGQIVQAGQGLLVVVPLQNVW